MIQIKNELASLEDGMNEFIVDCKVRNLAADTIAYYNKCFKSFMNYVKENYVDLNIRKDINKHIIDGYVLYMRKNNLKDTTININLRGIRSILYYFMKEHYIEVFEIKLIKEDDKIPKLYTDEEIKKLLKKPNMKTCTFAEYRTWTIINFFVATGVRSRTLRNIKIKDLDFENELIYLTTMKGRRMLVIPMSMTLKKILLEYLKIRKGQKEDYMFCNLEGNQLTQNALNNIISKYNNHRNVEKTGIHLFRHYFAKNYIQNGGNAFKLQRLLGHTTLAQTQKYVDLFGQDLRKDFDKYNPLDNLCISKDRIKIK